MSTTAFNLTKHLCKHQQEIQCDDYLILVYYVKCICLNAHNLLTAYNLLAKKHFYWAERINNNWLNQRRREQKKIIIEQQQMYTTKVSVDWIPVSMLWI